MYAIRSYYEYPNTTIVKISRNPKINATPKAYKYCLTMFLVNCWWYEFSKPENTALTPLAIKAIDNTKTEDNKPPRWDWSIFSKIFWKKNSEVFGGKKESKNLKNSILKSSIGTYGITIKTNNKNGNNAIKKLKAMALALVVRAPFAIPIT